MRGCLLFLILLKIYFFFYNNLKTFNVFILNRLINISYYFSSDIIRNKFFFILLNSIKYQTYISPRKYFNKIIRNLLSGFYFIKFFNLSI